jgi:hypothetical protein
MRAASTETPKAKKASAKSSGAPIGCMSQAATSGQPPFSHSRAWTR